MKKLLFLSLFSLVVYTACKKDSLGTKPVLSFISYSSNPIIAAGGADVTFNIKDGDGDVENTFNFTAIYDRDPTDTNFAARQMPGLENFKGSKLDAEVVLHLLDNDLNVNAVPGLKDSVHFLVYVIDNANNSSDTIATPKVQIIYPEQ
jgi:hypothetical protein